LSATVLEDFYINTNTNKITAAYGVAICYLGYKENNYSRIGILQEQFRSVMGRTVCRPVSTTSLVRASLTFSPL